MVVRLVVVLSLFDLKGFSLRVSTPPSKLTREESIRFCFNVIILLIGWLVVLRCSSNSLVGFRVVVGRLVGLSGTDVVGRLVFLFGLKVVTTLSTR